jgi:hypothetical protein
MAPFLRSDLITGVQDAFVGAADVPGRPATGNPARSPLWRSKSPAADVFDTANARQW